MGVFRPVFDKLHFGAGPVGSFHQAFHMSTAGTKRALKSLRRIGADMAKTPARLLTRAARCSASPAPVEKPPATTRRQMLLIMAYPRSTGMQPILIGALRQVLRRCAMPSQARNVYPATVTPQELGQPLNLQRCGHVSVAEDDTGPAGSALDEKRHANVHGFGLAWNAEAAVILRELLHRLAHETIPHLSADPESRQAGAALQRALKLPKGLDRVGHDVDGVVDTRPMKAVGRRKGLAVSEIAAVPFYQVSFLQRQIHEVFYDAMPIIDQEMGLIFYQGGMKGTIPGNFFSLSASRNARQQRSTGSIREYGLRRSREARRWSWLTVVMP